MSKSSCRHRKVKPLLTEAQRWEIAWPKQSISAEEFLNQVAGGRSCRARIATLIYRGPCSLFVAFGNFQPPGIRGGSGSGPKLGGGLSHVLDFRREISLAGGGSLGRASL
jgi:hypothetical protein